MEDKIITLKNYDTMVDAMIDQEVLRVNEIECFIGNEQLVELYPMFSDVDQGLKVVVFEKDFERSLKILEDYHAEDQKSEMRSEE
ncbi:MAG TPA: hypothetical protein VIK55_00640 [Paludibacter sp.]